jgi:hypothetical protein
MRALIISDIHANLPALEAVHAAAPQYGSRGFGHGVATWFLKAAGAKDGMDVEPCVLDVNSDLGAQYLLAMSLAGTPTAALTPSRKTSRSSADNS